MCTLLNGRKFKITEMEVMEVIELKEGRDYTMSALVKALNKEYGSKRSGKEFTLGDIQQYVRRGFIPRLYGGQDIEVVENEKVGVKVLRLISKK